MMVKIKFSKFKVLEDICPNRGSGGTGSGVTTRVTPVGNNFDELLARIRDIRSLEK